MPISKAYNGVYPFLVNSTTLLVSNHFLLKCSNYPVAHLPGDFCYYSCHPSGDTPVVDLYIPDYRI